MMRKTLYLLSALVSLAASNAGGDQAKGIKIAEIDGGVSGGDRAGFSHHFAVNGNSHVGGAGGAGEGHHYRQQPGCMSPFHFSLRLLKFKREGRGCINVPGGDR